MLDFNGELRTFDGIRHGFRNAVPPMLAKAMFTHLFTGAGLVETLPRVAKTPKQEYA